MPAAACPATLRAYLQAIEPIRLQHPERDLPSFLGEDFTTHPVHAEPHGLMEALQFLPQIQAKLGKAREMSLSPPEMRWALARCAALYLKDLKPRSGDSRPHSDEQDPVLASVQLAALARKHSSRADHLNDVKAATILKTIDSDLLSHLDNSQRSYVLSLVRTPGQGPDPLSPAVIARLLGLRLRILSERQSLQNGVSVPMVEEASYGAEADPDGPAALEILLVDRGPGGAVEPVLPKQISTKG